MTDASDMIAALDLAPHPEGGHYRETWRHDPGDGSRGAGTAILYLLAAGERSHWHRVDADELYHFHGGAPLAVSLAADDGTEPVEHLLGMDLGAGQTPQLRVPAGWWQAATSTGAWTLIGCTVSPAFTFDTFELAPADFVPGR